MFKVSRQASKTPGKEIIGHSAEHSVTMKKIYLRPSPTRGSLVSNCNA